MVVNFEIIIVYKQDAVETDEDHGSIISDVLTPLTDVQIYNVTMTNILETDIMGKLLFACDENNNDVILIIGNIDSVEKRLVTTAIKNISDSQKLVEYVAVLKLNIETRLKDIMPHQVTCGIRNRTLIIDLCGPHKNTKDCLKAAIDIILPVVHTIRRAKDVNIPPHDVASISDNKSIKQKEAKIALKRRTKSTSPLTLSPDKSIIKRRKEAFPMVSLADALFKLREITNKSAKEVAFEMVQLNDAYGRILCETVEAAYDLPPFKTSTKHGYAVLACDGKGLRKVLLSVENPSPSMSLKSGTCVWVKSGAPIPDGATAVIQEEDTKIAEEFEGNDVAYIEIMVDPQNEQNIKPVGYDLPKGKNIALPFERIGPKEITLLAASGRKEVLVAKHISIGVLSIGSNLGELEKPLKPGFVYDINRLVLISLLKEKGFPSLDFGIVKDKMSPIQNKTMEAFRKVDLLLTTGSTNDRGLLKTLLEEYYNADVHFGKVNVKPGKSTIFATCKINNTKKFFLCLPGNPTSAFIGAHIFLLPLVNELSCNFQSEQVVIPARMANQYTLHSRSRVAWTILEWTEKEKCALAFSRGNTVSDKLVSAVGANALLFLPRKGTAKEPSQSLIPAVLVKIPNKFNKNEKNFCDALPKPGTT